MKKIISASLFTAFFLIGVCAGAWANDSLTVKVLPFYKHRPDGKPGRALMLYFKATVLKGKNTIAVESGTTKEVLHIDEKNELDSLEVLLPAGLSVQTDCQVKIAVQQAQTKLERTVTVPALRQWTVYIYPHSHVDIGYTNTQANVQVIHTRNLLNGIELAKKTAGYPKDARYSWNPEVLWPVERYLKTAAARQRQYIIDAVKKGYLNLDASYVNTNTSAAADEELFEFMGHGKTLEKLTGTKIKTYVQVDVPGMSWGVVPVAAQLGIKYVLAFNNGSDRVGRSTELSFKPFWWVGPDGKSKVLFLQPGSYTPGERAKGHDYWPKMLGQTDTSKLLPIVKTDHPRQHFVDGYLADILPKLERSDDYPYDIFAMSWAMADNTPIDADLPEAVKSWNKEYAFPHLVIAGATEMMQAFEKKYSDQLPVLSGDFTEYWTDGLGTAARQTSMNRFTKERLIQDETLWTMLNSGKPAPRTALTEAWRNVSMGTEHTWCYFAPSKQPITSEILNVKFGYFQKADSLSRVLKDQALAPVADQQSNIYGVFNTLSWKRSQVVRLSKEQSKNYQSVTNEAGTPVLSQRLSTGELIFLADDVPALGSGNFILKERGGSPGGLLAHNNVLDNGIIKLTVDTSTGAICSLVKDKVEFAAAKAAQGEGVNSFHYMISTGQGNIVSGTSNVKVVVLENGPLLASLLITSTAEGCNSLSRTITLIKGQDYVDIRNVVDKQAVTKKEGVHFGFAFNIPDPENRVDVPWGIMAIDKDQLSGANRNWIGFQRWMDISNKEKGVTFCSLDAPVLEIGNMSAAIIGGATNSPKWIQHLAPAATIYSWALNNHWHTNFPLSQEGKLVFRYRILLHNATYNAGSANRFGMEQAQPLIISPIKQRLHLAPIVSLTDDPKIAVSILKTESANRLWLRLRSVSNKDEVIKIKWPERKPVSIVIVGENNKLIKKEAGQELLVPAMGFLTLEAVY